VLPAAVTAAVLASATPALAARVHGGVNRRVSHSTSTNWSGYAVTGHGPYTRVSSSWIVPSVDCGQTPNSYSSFWVGLDGDTTNTVEQTGTDSDCNGTSATYYGWYEMYPKYPVNFSNPMSPGDLMTASVVESNGGSFTLTLIDRPAHGTGWTQTTTQRLKQAKLGSAEVITEAPWSGGVLPLSDFGTVNYSGATVNGSALTASTPGLDPITMVNSSGGVKSATSGISAGSFSNTWKSS
jgi:hypothetical protein